MILTILFYAIIAFMAYRGWKQGALCTIIILMGWVAAAFLITAYGGRASAWVYETIVEPWVIRTVQEKMTTESIQLIATDAMDGVQGVLDTLTGLLSGRTVDLQEAAQIALTDGDYAESITKTVLQPLLLSIMNMAAAFLILAACRFVFMGLASRVRRRRSFINSLFGSALGLVEGLAAGGVYGFILYELVQLDLMEPMWLTELVGEIVSIVL